MSLKVTLHDIAKELSLTAATVSRALNGDKTISEITRKKVKDTAAKLNYRPNKIATSLRNGKSGIIGVIIPSAEINFFGSVVHGIEKLANENGYSVLIFQSNESYESEIKGIETFLSERVDGILVSISKMTKKFEHFIEAKTANMPIVFFDRSKEGLGIFSVIIDDFLGAFIATDHLIKQGYKRIAHISGPQHLQVFAERLKGYKAALSYHKLVVKEEFIYEGNVSIESGKLAARYLLHLSDPPDAVFAVEDFTALGVIKHLKEKNIIIPDEFGVIGFANEAFGEHITPTLSTIDQQTINMGKEAFSLLARLIKKEIDLTYEYRKILEPIPIFRQSSLKLNFQG